jgi:beta-lactamase class A
MKLMSHRLISRLSARLALGVVLALLVSSAASAAGVSRARAASAAAPQAAPHVSCVAARHSNDKLATKMAHDIDARLTGRNSAVGLEETDTGTGVTCTYHASWHFYAASAIKATILAALLRKAQEQRRQLTASEKSLAWLMITQSDNDAATALWNDVGFSHMQHFLNLAKMSQTRLNAAWGLSLLTAHDETLLLTLLSGPNRILSEASRVYAQYLMSHVTASQRWGVPAGAPSGVTVHVKNGWLPYPVSSDWEINSIGFFTSRHPYRVYTIAMLTHANPTMAYGIDTIEDAAEVIHRDLNPGQHSVIGESTPNPFWGIPDEPVPAHKG